MRTPSPVVSMGGNVVGEVVFVTIVQKSWRGLGLLTVALVVVAGCSSAPATDSAPPGGARGAVEDHTTSDKPYIVGLGDSYMSGEGAIISNKNYGDSERFWTYWITGRLGQVFGDNNGRETIDYCHRSYSAPMHFGPEQYKSVNLACSGAKTGTFSEDGKYKPGIDFDSGKGGASQGQAALLEEFAKTHDVKAVLLSIGGNDLGFGPIIAQAVEAYVKEWVYEPWRHDEVGEIAVRQENLDKVSAGITNSIQNIQQAMANAGKAPESYSLVYSAPPIFIGTNDDNRYWGSASFYSRQNRGGCGINNKTLAWINGETMKTGGLFGNKYTVPGASNSLLNAMRKGIRDALPSLNGTSLTFVDSSEAFKGHQLCTKAVDPQANYKSRIGMDEGLPGSLTTPTQPPWKDNNGKKNEWVTPLEIFGAQKSGKLTESLLTEALGGSSEHAKQLPFHPNYWGQRALASCYDQAVAWNDSAGSQPKWVHCVPSGDSLDQAGRPSMKFDSNGNFS